MNRIVKRASRQFKGISWQNPLIGLLLRALDPLDYAIRRLRGWQDLPQYSVRVRSNGVSNQFGGRRFVREGANLRTLLEQEAAATPTADLLEIGCGCGRVAVALSTFVEGGSYTGMDIDPPSLAACQENPRLQRPGYRFQLLNIYNGVYNPRGQLTAATYTFPYATSSFDIIFLFSVFTHVLPDGVQNYAREISRMVRPSGRCLFSTFLMDHGHSSEGITFPHAHGQCRVMTPEIPEKAVGYELAFLDHTFSDAGLERTREPLFGEWRGRSSTVKPTVRFSQDVLVYRKKAP